MTLSGPELHGFTVDQPASSIRLLMPPTGEDQLVIPEWTGNEFLLPDGRRPAIRTLTPRRVDAANLELDLDVVIHNGGLVSGWADAVGPGDEAAVSGPARGYTIDTDASAFVLAGDETAIPAMSQLFERLPSDMPVIALIEIESPTARMELPHRSRATVEWLDLPAGAPPGQSLLAAVGGVDLQPGTRVWVAGEAAGVQRIRRQLFEERQFAREHAAVRGYWKHGRSGEAAEGQAP